MGDTPLSPSRPGGARYVSDRFIPSRDATNFAAFSYQENGENRTSVAAQWSEREVLSSLFAPRRALLDQGRLQ